MRAPITVTYRAVHKNTPWRKVRGHASLESALFGRKDGAPGLFGYQVRIDYKKHGEPLYAVIWEDHANFGFVLKKDSSSSDGTARVQVPVHVLLSYEANGGASLAELEVHFSPASAERAATTDVPNEVSQEVESLLSIQSEEGAVSLEEHLVRERSSALVAAKRADVLRTTGRLACESCSFDFGVSYGEIGNGFCEVHHTKPLGLRS